MIFEAIFPRRAEIRASGQARKTKIVWQFWFMGVLGITFGIAAIIYLLGPEVSFIGWVLYGFCLLAILFRPRYGVYLILFLALVGDAIMLPWYPFEKNLSSIESLFYINDKAIISPLELALLFTYLAWFIRYGVQRKLRFSHPVHPPHPVAFLHDR